MPGAFSDWSATDSALLGSAGVGIYGDVQTTKDLIKRGGQETNPLFGTPHPSGAALDQAALTGVAITALGAGLLEGKSRKRLLAGVTGFEAGLAYQNAHNAGADAPKRKFGEGFEAPLALGIASALFVDALMPNLSAYMKPATPGKPEIGISYERKF